MRISLPTMRNILVVACFSFLAINFAGCVVFSSPGPFITAGGPETVAPQHSEVGIALGTGASLFNGAHAGGNGGFARWRYGIADDWDLGADAMSVTHSDKNAFSLKAAARYQLSRHTRLEAGAGAADDSYGKSANGDIALTVGTRNDNALWNFYSSLRAARAQGYPGNIFGGGGSDSTAPPNTTFLLINFGTTARISQNQKFFFEGAFGMISPDHQQSGLGIFFGAGLLFDIGKTE